MFLGERLAKNNARTEKLKQYRRMGDDVEFEETYTYKQDRHFEKALNQNDGAFSTKFINGINTEQSIFDKTAVFRSSNTDN